MIKRLDRGDDLATRHVKRAKWERNKTSSYDGLAAFCRLLLASELHPPSLRKGKLNAREGRGGS